MRLSCPLRQIVLGVDHLRCLARGPRQRLELITPFRRLAQVDRREIAGLTPPGRLLLLGRHRTAADPRRRQFLNLQRERQLRVCGHPLNHGDELFHVVSRPHDPFERMAVRTRPQRCLLLDGPGYAVDPLRIRELRAQIPCLPHGEIGRRRLVCADIDRVRAFQVVAGGADSDRVLTRFQLGLRKPIPPLLIGDDGDGDWRAGLLGAHQYAFQRPVFHGADPARDRRLGTGLRVETVDWSEWEHDGAGSGRQTQQESQSHCNLRPVAVDCRMAGHERLVGSRF